MRDIARLLFGRDPGSPDEPYAPGDMEGFGLAERARRAGEWCGSTPGRGSLADVLFGAGSQRPANRDRGPNRR
jgi:hypothetical protein